MPVPKLECILQLAVGPRHSVPVPACFSYDAQDPYAVHIAIHTASQPEPVRWVFARDLLADGMVRPSGLGDVRIWPATSERFDHLRIELSSPSGRALLTVPINVVRPWLEQTYRLVPPESEGAALDLDTELHRLLGEVT
ncbi:SsgA family sporulation/cell division regulator [Streptomyces sp. NPDC003832]